MLLTWHQTAGQSDLSNNVQREISVTELYQPTDSPLPSIFNCPNSNFFTEGYTWSVGTHESHLAPVRYPHRSCCLTTISQMHSNCRIVRHRIRYNPNILLSMRAVTAHEKYSKFWRPTWVASQCSVDKEILFHYDYSVCSLTVWIV